MTGCHLATSEKILTIFIPFYRGEKFIVECLNSVYSQKTLHSYNVVLLASTDFEHLQCILEEFIYRGLKIVDTSSSVGIGSNWNNLFSLVDTPYFSILHQDDILLNTYVQDMIDFFSYLPSTVQLIHCSAYSIDNSNKCRIRYFEQFRKKISPKVISFSRGLFSLILFQPINCPTCVYRSSLKDTVGIFNTQLSDGLDFDYQLRVVLNRFDIAFCDAFLYAYRRHNSNASLQNIHEKSKYKELLHVFDINITKHNLRSLTYIRSFLLLIAYFLRIKDFIFSSR